MRVWNRIWAKINQQPPFDNESQRTVVLLRCVYLVLVVYYIVFFFVLGSYCWMYDRSFRISWVAIISEVSTLALLWLSYRQRISTNLKLYVAAELLWLAGFVYLFGWDCGAQQIMFVLLVLVYFSFYDALLQKAAFTILLFLFRFALFSYTKWHDPFSRLPDMLSLVLQVWSSMSFFTLMGIICGFFSSNIESADKKLVLYNQRLREQASTDPLTGLWNRRTMRIYLNSNMEQNPKMAFSVCMGDIDLFKRVNDTYGHDCGDAVLKWLSERMKNKVEGKGQICRWGGEEFLMYFPEQNGDEVQQLLMEFLLDLDRTPFRWKEETIHISMTFGVEEYDFRSDADALIKGADEKLYIGKERGRDQVVF
ncbi:MAG: GGDEF domain-containing protein [Lachnospiraceae bacterium]|nr:GGDEF domain-containing protein [Lachnospiraceae bacterium]